MAYERDPIKTAFYNGTRWRKASRAYAKAKHYICEICNNKYANPDIKPFIKQFHVHHIKELVTEEDINDPNIALNEENFMLLCQHCHNVITRQKDVLAPGLMFDENGMVRKIE